MENIIKYYKLAILENYVKFSGRANRAEYWWFFLANIIISIVASILDAVIVSVGIPPFIGTIYSLAVLLPGLGLAFRRIHDTNRSAWWLLIGLIPLVGAIVLIWFFVQKGDDKKNNFGEPSKN